MYAACEIVFFYVAKQAVVSCRKRLDGIDLALRRAPGGVAGEKPNIRPGVDDATIRRSYVVDAMKVDLSESFQVIKLLQFVLCAIMKTSHARKWKVADSRVSGSQHPRIFCARAPQDFRNPSGMPQRGAKPLRTHI